MKRQRYIPYNPATDVDLPKVARPSVRPFTYSAEWLAGVAAVIVPRRAAVFIGTTRPVGWDEASTCVGAFYTALLCQRFPSQPGRRRAAFLDSPRLADQISVANGRRPRGQAVLEGVFMRLGEIGDDYAVVPEQFVADGDTVVMLGHYAWNHKSSGEPTRPVRGAGRLSDPGPRPPPSAQLPRPTRA